MKWNYISFSKKKKTNNTNKSPNEITNYLNGRKM